MKNKIRLAFIACSLFLGTSIAQYEMQKHTINSGGGSSEAGRFKVSGSVGQTDAGTTLSAGNYTIKGGFWQQNTDLIFKNNFK